MYLENLLRADMEVLEHGAGGSTLWFGERVKHVTSIESDLKWLEAVHERKTANVTLIYSRDVVFLCPVDLLLIDGEPIANRGKWLDAVPRVVKAGGYVILDNANRPEYASARACFSLKAKLLQTIDSNKGGTQFLVTEFYKWLG